MPEGARVWWDTVAREAVCTGCHPCDVDPAQSPSAHLVDAEGPGVSLAERPSWLRQLGSDSAVLSARHVKGRRSPLDHIVITPDAVWVIDVKPFRAKVKTRHVGRPFRTQLRLFVGGQDKTVLIDQLAWQVREVTNALQRAERHRVPVRAALCFTNASWSRLARPVVMRKVWVGPVDRMTTALLERSGSLPYPPMDLAAVLAAAFPPA
jgi:hypothetical protein